MAFSLLWSVTTDGFSGFQLAAGSASGDGSAVRASSRLSRLVGVSDGDVVTFDRIGVYTVVDGTNALDPIRPVVFAAQNGARLYFADGANYKRYNPAINAVEAWTASTGTIPASGEEKPRLITTWRGRTVLAGIPSDPDNWFMSRQNDPRDWDYSQEDDQAAIAGNNAEGLGKPPDLINCLIPYSDDLLIIGCDHSIWRIDGDPRHGGSMNLISDTVGIAWGRPFCKDADGSVYFVSSRGRAYKYSLGGGLQPISEQIDVYLEDIDFGLTIIRMAWDDEERGCYLILTSIHREKPTRHFFYDATRKSWFPDKFKKEDHNPRVVYLFDGDLPEDRKILIGCNDGYVRYFESRAGSDHGQVIESYCYLGPIHNIDGGVLLKELQATMMFDSGFVDWSIHTGISAAEALASNPVASSRFEAGRNRSMPARRHGHAIYIKLKNTTLNNRWAMEKLMLVLQGSGRIRQRTY